MLPAVPLSSCPRLQFGDEGFNAVIDAIADVVIVEQAQDFQHLPLPRIPLRQLQQGEAQVGAGVGGKL